MASTTTQAIMAAYGWKTMEDMVSSSQWAEAFKKTHSSQGALKELDTQLKEGVFLEGWFLNKREFVTEWKDNKPAKKTTGVVALMADGTISEFRNGQPLDVAAMSPVRIGPAKVRHVISEGKTRLLTPKKELKLEPASHSAVMPDLTLTKHLEYCRTVQQPPKNKKSTKVVRGALNCRTNDNFPVLARLLVGSFETIQYFGPGGRFNNQHGEVRARAKDSTGIEVELRADGSQLLGHLGLDEEARPDDVREALEGQEVISSGQMQIGLQKTASSFIEKKDDEDFNFDYIPPEVEAWIAEAKNEGWLKVYKETTDDQGKPYKLYALFFNDDLKPDERAIDLLGRAVVDVVEQKPNKWWFYVHHEELQSPPQFEARYRAWTDGDNGRFVVPLAAMGQATRRTKYDDAAAEVDALLAKQTQQAPSA